MNQRLPGKRALVTGAGQGIGKAIALAFREQGAVVHAIDLSGEALERLRAEDPAINTLQLDVCDPVAIERCTSEIGPIDILTNCVGYVHHGTILECSDDDWQRSLDINATSMVRLIRQVLPGMLAARRGCILNVSSVVSSLRGAPNRFAYGASKATVIGITKSIAADFVKQGIRCNAICPGTIDTPSLEERIAAQGDAETVRAAFVARQPMGRLGTPEEVAALAVYLASDEASFTTGGVHIIDGGWCT